MNKAQPKHRPRSLKMALLWRLILSISISGAVVLGGIYLIEFYTNHGKTVVVPNLYKRSLIEVYRIVDDRGFDFEVMDSSKFNSKIPPFSIVDQNPKAGKKVKSGRKIYLSVNPSGFRKIKIPHIIQVTHRNAIAMLRASHLEEERTIYVPNIGKNMVLAMLFHGDTISPETLVPEMSKITLICGDGNPVK